MTAFKSNIYISYKKIKRTNNKGTEKKKHVTLNIDKNFVQYTYR